MPARLRLQEVTLARLIAAGICGKRKYIRIEMIRMTANSSIRVKPRRTRARRSGSRFIGVGPWGRGADLLPQARGQVTEGGPRGSRPPAGRRQEALAEAATAACSSATRVVRSQLNSGR